MPGWGIYNRILFCKNWTIDYQHRSVRQSVAFEAIPTPQAIGRHSKVVGHRENGIAAANSVACWLPRVRNLARIGGPSSRNRDDDLAVRL
jgi:hypothetical protein